MRNRPSRRPSRCLGNALVELALATPVLTLLFMGATDFARAMYANIVLTHAVSTGVDYGAQGAGLAATLPYIQQVVLNDASDLAGVTATATRTCSCTGPTGSVDCTTGTCSSNAPLQIYLTVTGQYTLGTVVQYPGLPNGIAIMRTAVRRVR